MKKNRIWFLFVLLLCTALTLGIVAFARGDTAIDWTDRYKFYTMATRAYAVVATGELAPYASILLQKGDVTPGML